jgi:hypothetical protein
MFVFGQQLTPVLGSGTSLTVSLGQHLIFAGTSAVTVTLPDMTNENGNILAISNTSTQPATITGPQTILGIGINGNLTLAQNAVVILMATSLSGANHWYVLSQTQSVATPNSPVIPSATWSATNSGNGVSVDFGIVTGISFPNNYNGNTNFPTYTQTVNHNIGRVPVIVLAQAMNFGTSDYYKASTRLPTSTNFTLDILNGPISAGNTSTNLKVGWVAIG